MSTYSLFIVLGLFSQVLSFFNVTMLEQLEKREDCFVMNQRTKGKVLKEVTYTGEGDCMKLCRQTKGCRAAVTSPRNWAVTGCYAIGKYTLTNEGAHGWATATRKCIRKARLAARTKKPAAGPPPAPNMNSLNANEGVVEDNVDFWGADIRNFKSKGLRDCYNSCRSQTGCVSFTMRKSDNNCWLKKQRNGANRKTNQPHLVSVNLVMNPLKADEGVVEDNVDFWGADIRNFKSKGLRDCYNNCRSQTGCVSFTMRKSDNNCWLKKQRNGANRKTNQPHLVSVNLVFKSPDCGYQDYKLNVGMFSDDNKLRQRTLQSYDACKRWCNEHADCKAAVVSPDYWAHRECFLVSTSTITSRPGWRTALRNECE